MGNHSIKAVIKHGTVENVKEVLEKDEDGKLVNQEFRYAWTPVHLAIHYHNFEVFKYLCENTKANLSHVDNDGSTLLHHALYYADTHWEFVEYLLDSHKFKFDGHADTYGNTTLHLVFKICTIKQIEELKKYFKEAKDVFSLTNNHKKTPLDILKDRCKGNEESLKIVEQLKQDIEKPVEEEEEEDEGEKKKKGLIGKILHKHDDKDHHKEEGENGSKEGEGSGSSREKKPPRKGSSLLDKIIHHDKSHSEDDKKHSEDDKKHSDDDENYSDESAAADAQLDRLSDSSDKARAEKYHNKHGKKDKKHSGEKLAKSSNKNKNQEKDKEETEQ